MRLPLLNVLCFLGLAAFAGKPAPLPNRTWLDKNFIVTYWCDPPATDENLARVEAEGFNLTSCPEEGLDVVAKHRLHALLKSPLLVPDALEDSSRRPLLDALVARVKRHSGLAGYFLVDEPDAGQFPALGKLVAYLHAQDPAHFAYLNLLPVYANQKQLGIVKAPLNHANAGIPTYFTGSGDAVQAKTSYRGHLEQFVQIVRPELLSYDHYHFYNRSDGTQYFLNLELMRSAALKARLPFMNIIQASSFENTWRMPVASEIRWLAFTCMAYGSHGISYFTYWGPKSFHGLYQDGQASPLMKDVSALNHEISTLGPVMMGLVTMGLYHTDPLPPGTQPIPANSPVTIEGSGDFILGLFGTRNDTNAFMIVNRSYHAVAEAKVTLRMPGGGLQELSHTSGKWSKVMPLGKDRGMMVQLQPGDGRLFRIEP